MLYSCITSPSLNIFYIVLLFIITVYLFLNIIFISGPSWFALPVLHGCILTYYSSVLWQSLFKYYYKADLKTVSTVT